MRKSVLLFCLLFIAFCRSAVGQTAALEALPASGLYRNSVYLELAGNAGVVSLNYERLLPLANPKNTLVLRAGIIGAPYFRDEGFEYEMLLPLEASILMGKRAVKLELGLGTTLHRYQSNYVNVYGERKRNSENEFIPVLRIGGRWQPPGKHWFIRVAATPFLEEYYTVIKFPFSPWAGISVGYNFGRK